MPKCPQCGGELEAVEYPWHSALSPDQFAAVRAGDWFCTICKGSLARTAFRYFWNSELGIGREVNPAIVSIPRAELEELVEVLEVMIAMNEGLAAKCGVQTNPDHVRGIAAKFRVKYLEGK